MLGTVAIFTLKWLQSNPYYLRCETVPDVQPASTAPVFSRDRDNTNGWYPVQPIYRQNAAAQTRHVAGCRCAQTPIQPAKPQQPQLPEDVVLITPNSKPVVKPLNATTAKVDEQPVVLAAAQPSEETWTKLCNAMYKMIDMMTVLIQGKTAEIHGEDKKNKAAAEPKVVATSVSSVEP